MSPIVSRADVERYLHEHIPISAAMGFRVGRADRDGVELVAPIGPNVNHRSTVFGGSSVSIAILAAWTLVHLRTLELAGTYRVVIRRSEMEYLAPISGEFHGRCDSPGEREWSRFVAALGRRGKAQITLTATVNSGIEVAGTFVGTYAALAVDVG